jgi:hypothetical protein
MRLACIVIVLASSAAVACGGTPRYDVTVTFNATVTQEDLDEVADLLLSYDGDADVLVQESFPPVARAVIETGVPNLCRTVSAELEGRSYVERVTCEGHRRSWSGDPEQPVSYP